MCVCAWEREGGNLTVDELERCWLVRVHGLAVVGVLQAGRGEDLLLQLAESLSASAALSILLEGNPGKGDDRHGGLLVFYV